MEFRKTCLIVTVAAIAFMYCLGPGAEPGYTEGLRLKMDKIADVGKNDDLFHSISSVCEDDDGNFYVLDYKKHRVTKFNSKGEKLSAFGNRGEGPGEFKSPSRLSFSPGTGVVVTEMMNEATIFSKEGKAVKKINFAKSLGFLFNIRFIGGNLFYAEKQGDRDVRHQILMTSEGKPVDSDLFFCAGWTLNLPSGEQYRLSYKELTPRLVFGCYKSRAVVGRSDQYKVKIIDAKGGVINEIRRDVGGGALSEKEHRLFSQKIKDTKRWPGNVLKAFQKKIPNEKMFFIKLMITSSHVFVFRIKKDCSDENSLYPVDVFTHDGTFRGELSLPKLPLLISDRYIYIKEDSDEDEPLYLSKHGYKL